MATQAPGALLIAIGDELLRGETVDTNAAFIAGRLTSRGVAVLRKLTIPDELELIASELRSAMPAYEYVITTGGIGPTPDDMTRQAAAMALGVPLELHPDAVESYVRRSGMPLTPGQEEMCRLPKGCGLITLPGGGAPGFFAGNLYVLPGVPSILKAMWPGLEERFGGTPDYTACFTVRVGESRFAPLLAEFCSHNRQVKIGSYPHLSETGWEVELRLRGKDKAMVDEAASILRELIDQLTTPS